MDPLFEINELVEKRGMEQALDAPGEDLLSSNSSREKSHFGSSNIQALLNEKVDAFPKIIKNVAPITLPKIQFNQDIISDISRGDQLNNAILAQSPTPPSIFQSQVSQRSQNSKKSGGSQLKFKIVKVK